MLQQPAPRSTWSSGIAGAPRLGFCSCERVEPRPTIPKDGEDLPGCGPWQVWLQEWEERQRREYKLHEKYTKDLVNATKEVVEAMKYELLDRLAQLGPGSALNSPSKDMEGVKSPPPCEAGQGTVRFFNMNSGGGSGSVTLFTPSPPALPQEAKLSEIVAMGHISEKPKTEEKPVPTHKMNQAMNAVCGGLKYAECKSMTHTISQKERDRMRRNKLQQFLYAIVAHEAFGMCSGGMILVYSIAVGVMADIEMRAAVAKTPPPIWRWYVDIFFTSSFIIEAVLNVSANGRYYFISKDWKWNIFDLIVALVGLVDLMDVYQLVNLGFMRILRTVRAVRILRVIRIFSVFKDLRVMIASILCCLPSLTWAFTLLVSVIYIFSVILMQGASTFLAENPDGTDATEILTEDFGDIYRTIYSLTQAVSGGRSWGEFAAPFVVINPWYGIIFTLFVIFVVFGVLNILTGVFVEGTTSLANVDKELVIQEQMAQQESCISQIRSLFQELDADESGTLSFAELTSNLQDDRVKAYFAMLEMDVSEAKGLFQLLDRDESGEVSIEEFIMTCQRLKGTARSIDLATMLFESKRLHSVIKHFMRSVDRQVHVISEKLENMKRLQENALYT